MTNEQLDILIKTARIMVERPDTSEYSNNVREVGRIALHSLLQLSGNSEQVSLRDGINAIRASGVSIDAEKIKAERDDLNSPAIPEGWALVPAKATAAMVSAAGRAAREYMEEYGGNSPQVIYQAMLAAAPQPGESS
ncbi:hypothetical protein ABRP55_20395 [Pectobacterium zantedeschiae]|uniref:hypothetical protein n=1 Tax=Pectobacterium zantedeschiae TaxID=2034769 RepID=UPI0032EEEEBA